VNHVPAKKFNPKYGDARRFLIGKYGAHQVRPFGIIDYAVSEGVISKYQAQLLQYMMDGDSPSDLACRFPEEAASAVQTNVFLALKALRHDPRVKDWAESLGFNPEAVKGRRFESEHRHDDGRPEGPAPQRPFLCTCDRAKDYAEDALDKADPFLAWQAEDVRQAEDAHHRGGMPAPRGAGVGLTPMTVLRWFNEGKLTGTSGLPLPCLDRRSVGLDRTHPPGNRTEVNKLHYPPTLIEDYRR
jgi:hypothetical protein